MLNISVFCLNLNLALNNSTCRPKWSLDSSLSVCKEMQIKPYTIGFYHCCPK